MVRWLQQFQIYVLVYGFSNCLQTKTLMVLMYTWNCMLLIVSVSLHAIFCTWHRTTVDIHPFSDAAKWTKYVQSIFKQHTGKHVGPSTLRSSFITYLMDGDVTTNEATLRSVAHAMRHSTHYVRSLKQHRNWSWSLSFFTCSKGRSMTGERARTKLWMGWSWQLPLQEKYWMPITVLPLTQMTLFPREVHRLFSFWRDGLWW